SQRRKTLLNTLSSSKLLPMIGEEEKATIKSLTEVVIRKAGIAPTTRAEDLTLEDFVRLTLAFAE
ncbi:MAG: ribosomal RNA small subunit methyltransferase A, partial [Desulfocapsaceae bacterium]|nr:ribosomal RNA small subunit methyltransferase A [Desulfocapsaceae bacterium]